MRQQLSAPLMEKLCQYLHEIQGGGFAEESGRGPCATR